MVAKNAELMVQTEKRRLGLERKVNSQKGQLARDQRHRKQKKKKDDADGGASSSRSRRDRRRKKKKKDKGVLDEHSSYTSDSLSSYSSDDEDFWQATRLQLPMAPTLETRTPTKDATLMVAVTNPISGDTGAAGPSAEPPPDSTPELLSDSSSSTGSSCDSFEFCEEEDTNVFEGTIPPSCHAGCSDPTCTQDRPEDYPVVAYA